MSKFWRWLTTSQRMDAHRDAITRNPATWGMKG